MLSAGRQLLSGTVRRMAAGAQGELHTAAND